MDRITNKIISDTIHRSFVNAYLGSFIKMSKAEQAAWRISKLGPGYRPLHNGL